MQPARQAAGPQARCRLQHPFFARLGALSFRLGEGDREPVMALALGERQATLPLAALQRELGIPPESEDGRMLALIVRSLDFVNELRPGEPLPGEVLGGEASWQPEPRHMQLAESRLRLQLAAWFTRSTAGQVTGADEEVVLAMADDPAMRSQVQSAFASMAQALDLESAEAVVTLLEEAARELAYAEALRARLLRRVEALAERLEGLARGTQAGASRLEVMIRIRRLMDVALTRLRARFAELDAETGEILGLLRNMEGKRALIRAHRDWFFASLRGWDPVLRDWEAHDGEAEERSMQRLGRTYRFLAPRYTPMQEWFSLGQAVRKPVPPKRQLVW